MPARAYTEAIVVTAASPRVVSHTVISRPPALVHEAGGFALECVASATALNVLASASAQKRLRREGGRDGEANGNCRGSCVCLVRGRRAGAGLSLASDHAAGALCGRRWQ